MTTAGEIIGYFLIAVISLIILICVIEIISSLTVVKKETAMILERFGEFKTVWHEGIHFKWPFIEKTRRIVWRDVETSYDGYGRQRVESFQTSRSVIDLREHVMDFPNQFIITRDNVEIQVHPMLVCKVVDPVKAFYEIYDICHAVEKLVQTTLRSIIGDMGLDDTLASREEINRNLSSKITKTVLNWGLKLSTVEVLEIIPTHTVQAAMHRQLGAERFRRAEIVSAEGFREQTKTLAEGNSQALISLSKGEQQVSVLIAKARADTKLELSKAEAQAVKIVSEVLSQVGVDATQYWIGLKYLETLHTISSQASKRVLVFPYENQLMGAVKDITQAQ